jgi:hypothetical protein
MKTLISITSIRQDIYEHIMCCKLLLMAYSKVNQAATHFSPTSLRTLRRVIFNHMPIR